MAEYTGLVGLVLFGTVLAVMGFVAARRERREHQRRPKN